MNIYLVRHTAVALSGVCYGQTDVALQDTFEEEAKLVKQNLNSIPVDAVYSSPLSRCTKLAHYCGYVDVILRDRLKELFFGDWEMQKWSDVDMTIWEEDWINTPAPNGESFQQMYKRVASFFNDLKLVQYNNVVVFAHGGVINCAKIYFGQTTIEHAFDIPTEYGEIVKFSL